MRRRVSGDRIQNTQLSESNDALVNFGDPGEQEMRFSRSRAIFLRLYPNHADQWS